MRIKDKKKFKKSMMITMAILLILLVFVVAIIKNINKKYNTIDDFGTVKEVLEYLKCDYIRTENSKEEDYDKNIHLRFNKDLYDNEGSNERFFNNLVQMVAKVSDYKSTILTDTDRNIVIKIKCNNKSRTYETYYINDIEDYFAKKDSSNSMEKFLKEENSKLTINSSLLQKLIKSNWRVNDSNFGSKESTFNNYDVYFEEGISVRIVTNKVFNIVFNSKYKDELVNNIKVGTSIEDIKNRLGYPTYEDKSANVIGYKNEDIYIFFTENEVSVYRVDDIYNEKFYEILEKFVNSEVDFQKFLDELTTLWPEYDEYMNTEESYILTYTLKGIRVQVTPENKDGIHLYTNYIGLKKNEDLQKFINSGKVHIEESNLIFENEVRRVLLEKELEYTYVNYMNYIEPEKKDSKLFYYMTSKNDEGIVNKVSFLSKDGNNPNNELKETMNSYIWYNDHIFLYGKAQDGIYMYDVINRETKKLLSGEDNFEIKGLEDNKLKYDNKSVQLQ